MGKVADIGASPTISKSKQAAQICRFECGTDFFYSFLELGRRDVFGRKTVHLIVL
jgi:hypothetical protein